MFSQGWLGKLSASITEILLYVSIQNKQNQNNKNFLSLKKYQMCMPVVRSDTIDVTALQMKQLFFSYQVCIKYKYSKLVFLLCTASFWIVDHCGYTIFLFVCTKFVQVEESSSPSESWNKNELWNKYLPARIGKIKLSW